MTENGGMRLTVSTAAGVLALAGIVLSAGMFIGSWDAGLKGNKADVVASEQRTKESLEDFKRQISEKINDKAAALNDRLIKVETKTDDNQRTLNQLAQDMVQVKGALQIPPRRADASPERSVR